MNKNIIITIITVLIILTVGTGYLLRGAKEDSSRQTEGIEQSNSSEPVAGKISVKEFMSLSGSQKCEFKDIETESSGEVFVRDGKMRGDFASQMNGNSVNSHMINNGTDIYIWMDNQTTGFKTSLKEVEQMSQQEGVTGVNQTVDLNKQVEYSCEPMSIDESKFTVPGDVKFQDTGAMMENIGKMQSSVPDGSIPTDANTAACAACNNLEGEQINQCRSALKCN